MYLYISLLHGFTFIPFPSHSRRFTVLVENRKRSKVASKEPAQLHAVQIKYKGNNFRLTAGPTFTVRCTHTYAQPPIIQYTS